MNAQISQNPTLFDNLNLAKTRLKKVSYSLGQTADRLFGFTPECGGNDKASIECSLAGKVDEILMLISAIEGETARLELGVGVNGVEIDCATATKGPQPAYGNQAKFTQRDF